jgi:hypothetical protein
VRSRGSRCRRRRRCACALRYFVCVVPFVVAGFFVFFVPFVVAE